MLHIACSIHRNHSNTPLIDFHSPPRLIHYIIHFSPTHGHLLSLLATPATLCKGWQSGSNIQEANIQIFACMPWGPALVLISQHEVPQYYWRCCISPVPAAAPMHMYHAPTQVNTLKTHRFFFQIMVTFCNATGVSTICKVQYLYVAATYRETPGERVAVADRTCSSIPKGSQTGVRGCSATGVALQKQHRSVT